MENNLKAQKGESNTGEMGYYCQHRDLLLIFFLWSSGSKFFTLSPTPLGARRTASNTELNSRAKALMRSLNGWCCCYCITICLRLKGEGTLAPLCGCPFSYSTELRLECLLFCCCFLFRFFVGVLFVFWKIYEIYAEFCIFNLRLIF